MSNTDHDPDFPVYMEGLPRGFWGTRQDILVAGKQIGVVRVNWRGRHEIELTDGTRLLLYRRGVLKPHWFLELEDGTRLGEARPAGFWQRRLEIGIGDRQGSLEPQNFWGSRRDYILDGAVRAWTSIRGVFKRGFVVHAQPSVSETEMLMIGLISARIRQQQAAAASS